MIARIRKAMDDKDQGFTLIELLVVMIIIGILAAIAIPVFLNQRESAVDAAIKSDLRGAATEVETIFVDTQSYPADDTAFLALTNELSPNTVLNYTLDATGDAYCLEGTNPGGSHDWVYDSNLGGLQPAATTACL